MRLDPTPCRSASARTMERPPGYKRGGLLSASVYNCLPPIYTTFQNENRCIYKTGDPLCKTRSIFLRKISRRVAPRKVFLIETILLTYSLAQIGVEIMLVFQQLLVKRVCTLTAIKGLFFALSLQSQIFTFTREGVCERRTQGNNSPEHRASI
jgi:hypothetical protein